MSSGITLADWRIAGRPYQKVEGKIVELLRFVPAPVQQCASDVPPIIATHWLRLEPGEVTQ